MDVNVDVDAEMATWIAVVVAAAKMKIARTLIGRRD